MYLNHPIVNCSLGIRHVRIEKGTAAKTRPTMVPGIVTKDAPVSYWPIFSCPL